MHFVEARRYLQMPSGSTLTFWRVRRRDDMQLSKVQIPPTLLKQKWGTPDVIGVLRPQAQDIIKFESQIISAEIKIDSAQPVVAFGQAVAYRLFSHKSFIAVPKTTGEDDLARVKALCSTHGVGLVTFTLDKEAPDFVTLVPANRQTRTCYMQMKWLEDC